jgi:hypothetical protein
MARRILTRWILLAVLLALAFIATAAALNSTIYSASGFVGSYLQSLARHDVAGALAMPGVSLAGEGSRELAKPATLASLRDIHLSKDLDDGGGRHTLRYSYSLNGKPGTTEFAVQHVGPRFGVFSGWRFVESPVTTVTITPEHATTFTANGVSQSSTDPGHGVKYRVLVPALITLSHTSPYLEAARTTTIVDAVGTTVDADIDIRANSTFVSEVKKQLDRYLADCVTQKVLLPTGCPMGKQITDRIQNEPTWSMKTYPVVSIVPSGADGAWQLPRSGGVAHLVVKVKSIFDGSVSNFDQDVPFTVSFRITFGSDGNPVIVGE